MIVANITTVEQLDAFRSEWGDLFSRSGSDNYFVSFEWIRACIVAFLGAGEWRVVVARDGDEVLALLPLRKRGREWGFLLVDNLADYCEILCDPQRVDAVEALVSHLLGEPDWGAVRLSCMPAGSSGARALAEILDRSAMPWLRSVMFVAPVVELAGTFGEFEKRLTKRVRQEIRTTRNHLNRLGEWRFEDVRGGPRALQIYDGLVAMHIGRQVDKVGASLFETEATREFLRGLIPTDGGLSDQGPPYGPVLTGLFVGERLVAAAYSLTCAGTFFYWIPSFDPSVKSVSLGKALIAHLIEGQFAAGSRLFDFMGGDEPYKYQWSGTQYEVLEITVFRTRFALLLSRARAWIIKRLRILVRRMPRLRALQVILSKIG